MKRHKWTGVEFRPNSMNVLEIAFSRYEIVAAALDAMYPGISLEQLKELLLWGVREAMDYDRQDLLRVKAKVKKHYVELTVVDTWMHQKIKKPDWVKPVITCSLPGFLIWQQGMDGFVKSGGRDWNYELAVNGVVI